ncbi:MAG TPA: tRNA pseudouridine(55) synthase TruB [Armatimonadota bacterium]|nr:tRNA pseudouridine(55) synthase TruB [Armatimonadota bacterium]
MDALHGILNLYKPVGPTSHDCVARARRILGTRRVGHAGTLDPMASGVLVMGIGSGTRILEYLQGFPKTYRARMRLGITTDTQDTTGQVLTETDAAAVTEPQVREVLARFSGPILQVPPMVSALKVGGKKLYELARRGETIEREARPVTVYRLDLLSFTPGPRPEAELRIECSGGTYVRTLCHDAGAALGVGAAMSALEREAVGPFRAEDAVRLEDLTPETPLVPLAEGLVHLPTVRLGAEEARRLAQGQFVPAPEGAPDGPVRVLDGGGILQAIAIVRGHGEARLLAPEKVFVGADAASTGA